MFHRRASGDHGYAIILMALVLIPMLGAAAVAVDLGSRYSAAADMQKAADAAALAGVVVLPRGLGAATTEARQVAARNGFVHDPLGPVTVEVSQISSDQVQVTITDSEPDSYFLGNFNTDEIVSRSATARYVRAIELGSARNFVGTGDILGTTFTGNDMRTVVTTPSGTLTAANTSSLRENIWLAISGRCSSRENGDRFNTVSQSNFSNNLNPRPLSGPSSGTNWVACNPGGAVQANPQLRPPTMAGYVYSVAFPTTYDYGQVQLQVWDPRSCNGPSSGQRASSEHGGSEAATSTFTVRTGSTDPFGGTVVSNQSFTPGTSSCTGWTTLTTVNPAQGSTYFVQVQAGTNTNNGTSSNAFALRARVTGRSGANFWACSSDPIEVSLFDAKCPQVAAVQDMGVLASLSTVSSGEPAEFFLAEIGDEYSGEQMEITLFDPGEGAEGLRLKAPDGTFAAFNWRVDCSAGVTAPTGGCSGVAPTTSLDLAGTLLTNGSRGCTSGGFDFDFNHDGTNDRCVQNPQPGGRRLSRSKYNDRPLTLTVDLPDDISAAYGGATWWKVEYTTNNAPTDRTTWSVRVHGDPVRLEPNP
jgi:Flp pilus assembly protein TadG